MRNVVFLPLDDRPCCWQFPQRLAQIAQVDLLLPPRALWGGEDKRQPERANPEGPKLLAWLKAASTSSFSAKQNGAEEAPSLLVSADALFYGGLVASRRPRPPYMVAPLLQRLLVELTGCSLYLFSVIMRVAPTQYTAAEVEGALRLTKLSQQFAQELEQCYAAAEQTEESAATCTTAVHSEDALVVAAVSQVAAAEVAHTEKNYRELNIRRRAAEAQVLSARNWSSLYELAPAFWQQYLGFRRRKDEINELLLEAWTKRAQTEACGGGFLALCLDDSKTTGLNLWEAKFLQEILKGCSSASIGVGTDETAMLLLARAICGHSQLEIVWPYAGAEEQIGRYEGKNLAQVLSSQAQWLNAALLPEGQSGPGSAVPQIFIYAPWQSQLEACSQADAKADLPESLWSAWQQKVAASLEAGKQVYIADLAYANGGSRQLVSWLIESGAVAKIAGYSAWNTLGNALGTILAWAALASWRRACPKFKASPAEQARFAKEQRRFLLERLLDDYFYQTLIRPQLSAKVGGAFVLLGKEQQLALESEILTQEKSYLAQLVQAWPEKELSPSLKVELPWRRLFEVGLEVEL